MCILTYFSIKTFLVAASQALCVDWDAVPSAEKRRRGTAEQMRTFGKILNKAVSIIRTLEIACIMQILVLIKTLLPYDQNKRTTLDLKCFSHILLLEICHQKDKDGERSISVKEHWY